MQILGQFSCVLLVVSRTPSQRLPWLYPEIKCTYFSLHHDQATVVLTHKKPVGPQLTNSDLFLKSFHNPLSRRKGLVGTSSRRYQKACSLQGELGKRREREKGK